jgi:hypothetical protein
MSKAQTSPATSKTIDDHADAKLVMIDYRGTVGSAPHQRDVPHTRSPLVLNLYENGIPDLVIQPGLNLCSPANWQAYSTRDKQTGELVNRKQLKVLRELPEDEDELVALIERTISRAALDFIQVAVEKTATDPDRRKALLDAINTQRSTTTCIEIEPRAYVPAAGINVEKIERGNDVMRAFADLISKATQGQTTAHA